MNNLRNLRKKKGISLNELAELTGIPFRTLQDWDGEKRQIQAYHRIKILAKVLDCDMDAVMEKEEKCIYDGMEAVCVLVQWEDGVHIYLMKDDDFYTEIARDIIMPREDALELLDQIKNRKDIKSFLYKYIK